MTFDIPEWRAGLEGLKAQDLKIDYWLMVALGALIKDVGQLEWVALDKGTMLAETDGALVYITSTRRETKDLDRITIRHLPLSLLVGVELEVDAMWIDDRWEGQTRPSRDFGHALIRFDHPDVATIEIPIEGDATDADKLALVARLQERLST